jgi:hypothetical protein
VNASQSLPCQPAYRHRWSDPAEGRAVHEDSERQTPLPYGQPKTCERGLQCSGQGLPTVIVTNQIQIAFLIDRIHVHELRAPLCLPQACEDSSSHEPEFLRAGDEHTNSGILSRGRGQSRNHAGAVVPGSVGMSLQPTPAGEHAGDDAHHDPCARQHR